MLYINVIDNVLLIVEVDTTAHLFIDFISMHLLRNGCTALACLQLPLSSFTGPKRKVEHLAVTRNEGLFWMGKRSSKESKKEHFDRYKARKILLDYSLHDKLIGETVYAPEYAVVVREHLQAELGFSQNFAEFGEVLLGPCGESPTLAQFSKPDEDEEDDVFSLGAF